MKIFQVKISNPIAYLLIVFIITAVALAFYGQFSNVEINTIENNIDATAPVIKDAEPVVGDTTPAESSGAPAADEAVPTTPLVEEVAPAVE